MPKAQADIVSAVIIVLLALSLTSSALIWGLPLIQKRQDSVLVARVSNIFNQDLPSKIGYVASVGGSTTLSLDIDGIWVLNETENSISFTFPSKVSDKGLNQWIGEGCPFTGQTGTVGIDKPSVVCVFVSQTETGFNITYKIGFRELISSDGTKGYKIQLVKPSGGVSVSTGKTLYISQKSVSQLPPVGQKILIKTEIEILL